jgi:Lar family restriction alleviation protein
MTEELLPCPFCGSTDLREITPDHIDYAQVWCGGCTATGPLKDCVGNYKRPAEAWNTRAPDPLLAKMAEALRFAATGLRILVQDLDENSVYRYTLSHCRSVLAEYDAQKGDQK